MEGIHMAVKRDLKIIKVRPKCLNFSTFFAILLILNFIQESAPILSKGNDNSPPDKVVRRQSGPDTFFQEENPRGRDPPTFFRAAGADADAEQGQGGPNLQFPGQPGQSVNGNVFGHVKESSSSPSCPGGRGEVCQLYTKCALYQPEILGSKNAPSTASASKCTLEDDSEGICCKIISKNRADTPASPQQMNQAELDIQTRFLAAVGASSGPKTGGPSNQQPIDFATLENHLATTQTYFTSYDTTEKRLLDRNLSVKKGTSSFGHLLFFQTSPRAIELSRLALRLVHTTQQLKTDPLQTRIFESAANINSNPGGNDLDGDTQYGIGVKVVNTLGSSIGGQCPARVVCDPIFRFHRTVDGTCNNLVNSKHGAALTPLLRLVQPAYADGIWTSRQSRTNLPLPSARLLSSSFNQDVDNPNPFYSLWVMQFGQFLDHDLSHVPVFRFSNGSGIECCSEDGDFLPQMQTHPMCLPIEIPADDGFYRPFRQRCMNFVRSMIGPRENCNLGYGDQLNQITSYLDNSNMYGSLPAVHNQLREFKDGRLTIGQGQGGQTNSGFFGPAQNQNQNQNSNRNRQGSSPRKGILPLQTSSADDCTDPATGLQCFLAGDLRVNEMIGLTVTHVIWLREHNRVAGILKGLNPHWNDDQLFKEARRIVNAEYQHIIYNEWLPIVVGRQYMEVYGILPQTSGYYAGYNQNVNPGVSNAFSAAAFRMGHTLIQGLLPLINEAGRVEENLVIHEHFNRPFRIQERRMVDKLIRTLSTKNIQGFDRFVTSEVTNRLFQADQALFGMDLISLNIQRARDHGVPGYNTYRQLCQLKRAKKFSDFQDWISRDLTEKLSRYYDHVDDVDLFIGGILENPLPGALLGPTFTCIIGDQFARARKGDRFSYDVGPFPTSFSLGQLYEIRKASYARILCDNGDNLETIQPFVFIVPSHRNPLLSCDSRSIPKLDLSQWRFSVQNVGPFNSNNNS